MKKIISSVVTVLLSLSAFTQSIDDFRVADGRVNDAKLVEHVMEKKYPGYKNYMDNWYNNLANQVNNMDLSNTANRSVLRIPVVVHIVWKTTSENIPQTAIDRQIDILNEDFNRSNEDTVNLRNVFKPIAGNPRIEFVLAGVERVNTTTDFTFNFSNLYDDIKHSSTGGSDAWSTSHYLNIWVGNLQGGFIAGYAYPPAGAPGWPGGSSASNPGDDGVVIHYQSWPTGIFSPGRTSVHEVGHYLGLRHIWGDGDCTADDNVSDTPIADSESSFDCDTTKNSCNQGAGDLPDMVENYMDYSNENCQNSFTQGQATLMRTVLQTYRPNLIPTADIEEFTSDVTLNLYPNPSNGIVNFSISGTDVKQIDIVVMDLSGKTIFAKNNVAVNGSLDLSSFNKGLYLVQVKDNDFVVTKKITIN